MAGFTMALAVALACVVSNAGWAAETADKQKDAAAERRQKLEAAQKRLDSAAREIADLSMSVAGGDGQAIRGVVGRPILGVNIGSRGSEDRAEGVEVVSVSPGGPAAEAGIKAGDVIVEIEGKALKNDEDGTPRVKLLGAMRRIEPDEKVVVKYRREGKTSTATITPHRMADRLFAAPGMPFPGPSFRTGPGPHVTFMRAMGVFGNAELVSLTPKLGQYFGAEKGLLVVRAPDDTRLKLEEGDVILDIDGRIPNSPSHAMRILSSYQAGEKLKLNVLRMKKRSAFEVTIPEGLEGFPMPEAGAFHMHTQMNPFELPVPAPD
jgi:serine protease Do